MSRLKQVQRPILVFDEHVVEAFMAQDPFTEAGLIDSTTIVRWNKIYFDYAKVV